MIDLNCDMGEGMVQDEALMPWISSANIACGFHAGSGELMRRSIDLCLKYGVQIGAHPSFRDRENFGRKEMKLPEDKLYALIMEQLIRIDLIARERGARLYHVKPHGALYNLAAKDPKTARTIAQAVVDFDEDLVLFGLSGSHLITEGDALGLHTLNEVFADRTYEDDGTLTPRDINGAVIGDEDQSMQQVMQMVNEGCVTSRNGKKIPIYAETICLHSDGNHVVVFAKKIREALQSLPVASTPH
jgi:UPF0271 protein